MMSNESRWEEQIELIVFDVDGTLAETDDFYVEKSTSLICRILPFLPKESVKKAIRPFVMAGETLVHSFYRLLDLIGLDWVLSKGHSTFSVSDEYKYTAVQGMQDTLRLLQEKYLLGVITSGGRKSTKAFLEKFGISQLVTYVISAEDCQYIKPHPMALVTISETAKIPTSRCLMVGDTIFDILCAKRAGARSAAVKTGFDSEWFLKLHHPDLLMDSVNDLPERLNLNKAEIGKSEDKTKDLV